MVCRVMMPKKISTMLSQEPLIGRELQRDPGLIFGRAFSPGATGRSLAGGSPRVYWKARVRRVS
jgi:hypothetical protein